MEETKRTRFKERAQLIWSGALFSVAFGAFLLSDMDVWLKCLFLGIYGSLAWVSLKRGLFGSEGGRYDFFEKVEDYSKIEIAVSVILHLCSIIFFFIIAFASFSNVYPVAFLNVFSWLLGLFLLCIGVGLCFSLRDEVKQWRKKRQPNADVSKSIQKIPKPLHLKWEEDYNIGDRIANRYEVIQILEGSNKSGMGIVYKCHDSKANKLCTLKAIQNKYLHLNTVTYHFKKEVLARILLEKHPNIVHAQFATKLFIQLFVISEFIAPDEQGRNTLAHYLKEPIPLKQALTWSIQFCYGMEHAYSKGVSTHGDIRPENIMITSDRILKITDFGLAGFSEAAKISEDLMKLEQISFLRPFDKKVIAGTHAYMAPEEFKSMADARSDIYAFGIVMYQMINNGRLPFYPGEGDNWLKAHNSYPIFPQKSEGGKVSGLFAIIDRCLRKNPDERYANFKELRDALEVFYIEAIGEMPSLPPDNVRLDAWELYNKGASLHNIGCLNEAIKVYRKIIKISPKADYEPACLIGHDPTKDNRPLLPKIALDAYLMLGLALYDKDDFDEAIKVFRQLVRINPENASAHYKLGNALKDNGQIDEAIKAYKEAIRVNPEFAEAHNKLGLIFRDKGHLHEAIMEFKESIRANPEDTIANRNLKITANGKVFLDEAIEEYRKTLRFNGKEMACDYIKNNIDLDVSAMDVDIEKIRKSISSNTKDAKEHWKFGNSLRYKGLLDKAIKECRELIKTNSEDADAHYLLGNALYDKGFSEEAINEYKEAIRINSDYAKAYNNIGSILLKKGLLDETIVAFENFVKYAPPHYAGFFEITKGVIKQMRGGGKEKV